ncbi:MAG: epimerase [marine bacterium B5-7]|nr:MAG: epimerase [marine bacterium B5-7]
MGARYLSRRSSLLVVGGSGFIGGRIVEISRANGFEPVVLSRLKNIKTLEQGSDVESIHCDIRDRDDLENFLGDRQFSYVVNCGGYIDHASYSEGGDQVFNTHFSGLVNLVSILNESEIKGFVQLGSSDEYGRNPAPQAEEQRESPISCYSMAKVAATHFLQMLYRTEGFPAITIRPFLVYGPNQEIGRFLPQVIMGCLEGRSFPVSIGEQLRDFSYVDDIANAIILALKNDTCRGHVINVGSGSPVSIKGVVNRIKNLIGKGKPEFGKIPYRKGENMSLYPDVSKARSMLGWQPGIGLDEGLARTIDWYRQSMTKKLT